MAAPLANYVQLPHEGSFTGPLLRVVQRGIGANVTYTHVQAPITAKKLTGVFHADDGVLRAVVATAHNGTSTGYWWLQNPVGSTVVMRLRSLTVAVSNATAGAIDHDSAPRIVLARGTFTGAFNGATVTIARRKTTDAASVGDLRTAADGATVSVGSAVWGATVPGIDFEAADVLTLNYKEYWKPPEAEWVELAAGECLVLYQAENGTTNDQRLAGTSLSWDEYDAA